MLFFHLHKRADLVALPGNKQKYTTSIIINHAQELKRKEEEKQDYY